MEERERQWKLFHAEESADLPPERDARAVLADLSFLLQQCSPETVAEDPDPEKRGIALMRAALARVSPR